MPTTGTSRSAYSQTLFLATDDEPFKGVQLPRQFWKVVVMVKESGELSATGDLLSQEELIKGLEFLPEEFSYGAYSTFQVPINKIEELTACRCGLWSRLTRWNKSRPPLRRERSAVLGNSHYDERYNEQ